MGRRADPDDPLSSCLLMIVSLETKSLHKVLGSSSVIAGPQPHCLVRRGRHGLSGGRGHDPWPGQRSGTDHGRSLWYANGLGLAAGAGLYVPAILTTAFVLVVLVILQSLVRVLPRDTYWRVYLDFDTCGDKIAEIRAMLSDHQVKVLHTGFDCSYESSSSSYEVAIRIKITQNLEEVFGALRRLEGLTRLKWAEGYVP